MNSKFLKVGAAIIMLAGAGVLFARWYSRPGPDDIPQGLWWVCGNKDCKNAFRMTLEDYLDKKNVEWMAPCPKCGQYQARRAAPCPKCEQLVQLGTHQDMPPVCPHCKASTRKNPNAKKTTPR